MSPIKMVFLEVVSYYLGGAFVGGIGGMMYSDYKYERVDKSTNPIICRLDRIKELNVEANKKIDNLELKGFAFSTQK